MTKFIVIVLIALTLSACSGSINGHLKYADSDRTIIYDGDYTYNNSEELGTMHEE